MTEPPRVRLAHVGGSGTWGFRYPDGALDGHPYLSVRVVEPEIRLATPFGPSPPFRLCRLTDRRSGAERDYLYVWMHGLDPAEQPGDAPGTSVRASERVFDVLARAGVERVLVDNSTGAVAGDLAPGDLVVVSDVVDLSGAVPRPPAPRLVRFRDPLCPRLRASLIRAAEANLDRLAGALAPGLGPGRPPRVEPRGTYVHTFGPWFESPVEDRTYRALGFDVVGKTAGPEYRLARAYRMCLGILSIVVNPAEGLGDFEPAELLDAYRRCGPAMARMVMEAIADVGAALEAEPGRGCPCVEASPISLFGEFARFACYGGRPADGQSEGAPRPPASDRRDSAGGW